MTASFSLQKFNAKSDYSHNTLIRWTVISTELVLLWWWLYSYNYFYEYNYPSLLCRCKEDVGCVYTISPLNHSALKSLKTNARGLIMKPSWWSFTWHVWTCGGGITSVGRYFIPALMQWCFCVCYWTPYEQVGGLYQCLN